MADDADKKDATSTDAEAPADGTETDAAADVVDFDESDEAATSGDDADGDADSDDSDEADGDDSDLLDAEVAAAEAAAVAAAAQAAAAKAKAKAKAKKKGKSKGKEDGSKEKAKSDSKKASDAKGENKAKAKKASKGAARAFSPLAAVEPHSEGLFRVSNAKSPEEYVPPGPLHKRSAIAFAVLGLAVAALVVSGGIIYANEDYRHDMKCFFESAERLRACKLHEVRLKEKKWKEQDQAAVNRYGNVTVNYFPGDAVLKVTQMEFGQVGMTGESVAKDPRDIPNKSQKLTEGQTIERIPLTNLRIFEATKFPKGHAKEGEVDKAFKYEYKLEFTKPGYHSATVWLRDKTSGLPARKGGKSYYWERKGPGNLLIAWQGLDLEPKLETIKANFVALKTEVYCYLKTNTNEKIKEWKDVDETEREIMRLKHEFKDDAQFIAAEQGLTAGKYREWWEVEWKKIQETKCGEATK